MAPTAEPIIVTANIEMSPICKDTLPPCIDIRKTSRSSSSVQYQCSLDGGKLASSQLIRPISPVNIYSTKQEKKLIKIRSYKLVIAILFLTNFFLAMVQVETNFVNFKSSSLVSRSNCFSDSIFIPPHNEF